MNQPEHKEAKALFQWITLMEQFNPEYKLFFAVPNGGNRNLKTAVKLKAEGVRAGVSDYLLLVARKPHHGLVIELKPIKGGRVQDNQQEFLDNAAAQGYRAEVARGWEAAKDIILNYLQGAKW